MHEAVRAHVGMVTADRRMDVDIQKALELYRSDALPLGAVEA
jgi:histidine ammonia-lyase